jgi:hypothetical protein
MITALAVALFIIGLLNLFYKDLVWQLTSIGGSLEGLPTERTPSWDLWMTLTGAAAIVLGLVFWWW